MFKVTFTVRKAAWLSNPHLRWRAGLENAGMQFRQRIQRENYPPPPPFSRYIRTGTLANKAGFQIYDAGTSMFMLFGSTDYLDKLLHETPNWSGKKAEILDYMQRGFREGIKNYSTGA